MNATMNYSKVFTTTYDADRLSLAKYTKADGSVFYVDIRCYLVREREFRHVLNIFLSTQLGALPLMEHQKMRPTLDKNLKEKARLADHEMILKALLIRSMIDFEGADIEACSLFFELPQDLVRNLYESALHINMYMKA